MKVYLALDPCDAVRQKPRVAMQDRPFDSGHRPLEHQLTDPGWEYREAEIDEETWTKLLGCGFTSDEQDELHQRLWTESGPTPFPS